MKEKLKLYLDENLKPYIDENIDFYLENNLELSNLKFSESRKNLEDYNLEKDSILSNNIGTYIGKNKDENLFQTLLFKYIDERELNDSDVYNKVHIDRRLFSKIRNDSNYHPSKETVILLGLALELNEKEIDDFLESASYSLPKNNHYDLIIRFCCVNNIYKLTEVNEMLSTYDCKLFSY